MLDVVVQRDGRISTNRAIDPRLHIYRTVEVDVRAGYMVPGDLGPIPVIERLFRKVYSDRSVTVWVEDR